MSWPILLGLIFTWLIAPAALFLATLRATGEAGDERWPLLGICWGLAPLLISRIVTWGMYLGPGRSDAVYIGAVVAVVVGLGLAGLPQAGAAGAMLGEAARWLRRWGGTLLGGAVVSAALFLAMVSWDLAPLLTRSYQDAVGAWDPNAIGWRAVMPAFAAVLLVVFAVAAAARRHPVAEPRPQPRTGERWAVAAIVGALGAIVLLGLWLVLGRPVYENDAVQYFKVATLLHAEHSLARYPLMPAAPDGTYASSAHPLGQYGLLIWGIMLAGGSVPGPGKLLVFATSLATLGGIAIALRRHGAVTITAAMLLLMTTPGYFDQLVGLGIDAPRLAALLLATLACAYALRHGSWRVWVWAGVAAGLALNSHAESLIGAPMAIAAAVCLTDNLRRRQRIAALVTIAAVALAVGGERFLLNEIAFGSPIMNDVPIWHLVPSLDYRGWRSSVVPPHGWWGLLAKGPLLGFSSWYYFGFTWWLALLAVVLCHRAVWRDGALRVLAGTALGTFLVLAVYLGRPATGELLIGNYRYVLCIQPLIAILAGLLVGWTLDPYARRA